MTKRVLVKRIRRKMWGGRIDMRIYDNGSMRLHVDHPSNEPAVELAMGGAVLSMVREKFRDLGLEPPVIGPIKWNDDPDPSA